MSRSSKCEGRHWSSTQESSSPALSTSLQMPLIKSIPGLWKIFSWAKTKTCSEICLRNWLLEMHYFFFFFSRICNILPGYSYRPNLPRTISVKSLKAWTAWVCLKPRRNFISKWNFSKSQLKIVAVPYSYHHLFHLHCAWIISVHQTRQWLTVSNISSSLPQNEFHGQAISTC